MSLNNLFVQQTDTEDRDGALSSITEAVDIRRRLATADPADGPDAEKRVTAIVWRRNRHALR